MTVESGDNFEIGTDTVPLEPCPFCGSSNLAVSYSGQPAQSFTISCGACKTHGPSVPASSPAGGGFNPACFSKWNQRIGKGSANVCCEKEI